MEPIWKMMCLQNHANAAFSLHQHRKFCRNQFKY
uniref:Uncharacterized protein n=1 Tax=Arundo donax TaxID=35708 RepID=A0A0A9CJI5_ARUDO